MMNDSFYWHMFTTWLLDVFATVYNIDLQLLRNVPFEIVWVGAV